MTNHLQHHIPEAKIVKAFEQLFPVTTPTPKKCYLLVGRWIVMKGAGIVLVPYAYNILHELKVMRGNNLNKAGKVLLYEVFGC